MDRYPSARYVTPFLLFLILLALFPYLRLPPQWEAPIWVVVMAVTIAVLWPREIETRPRFPFSSIAIGLLVFVIWIGPDLLFPGYRRSAVFSNGILGHLHSSIPAAALRNPWVLSWRTIRALLIVPIVEELFWRAWLMRWLISTNFRHVPLGTYAPFAFWVTAVLFASEHGPYWDVGLITGVIYNAWMIRTKSVADCILMHAVTNGVLSVYVIAAAQWQFWQ